ncbi:MAG: aminotransferase class V [Deltaproteobacteria bacterium]|nr:aminotransferase class V [Deltaproteobacteria bacterium]
MKSTTAQTFGIASEDWLFEAIHRLNYKTFVEEIPQHRANPDKRLVDRFHHENTYIVCVRGDRLLGMVAVRAMRPFSLDQKLANLDSYLPPGRSVCEIRLLAVEPNSRSGVVFHGLLRALHDYCRAQGYNLGIVSGTLRQLKLYRHLGFVPFGPLVGADDAKFQPMYITLEAVGLRPERKIPRLRKENVSKSCVSFLPGPVTTSAIVRQRFGDLPRSHRSESFLAEFKATKRLLCDLVNANHAEILMGSGTLANDAIAAQLSLLSAPGLVLSNGEFGERLIDHARRFRLSFEILRINWGEIFHVSQIQEAIARHPEIRWLWAVHCETSTGILNDLAMLKDVCATNDLLVNLDCISSIGAVAVDLNGVYLASAVSGKGLAAFPGLSMVFHENELTPAPAALPRYLDLGYYESNDGIPFTISSNPLYALRAALELRSVDSHFTRVAQLASWLRAELRTMGLRIIGKDKHLSPAVTTVALPPTVRSRTLGKELDDTGYFLGYMSGYLLERNWLQICLMGEISELELRSLVEVLRRAITEQSSRSGIQPRYLLKQTETGRAANSSSW